MNPEIKNTNGDDRFLRKKKTTNLHQQMEMKKALTDVKDNFINNPETMSYFYNRFEAFIDPLNNEWDGKKMIATNCIYVPEELIYASGAIPLRICNGFYAYDQAGADFLPAKACPLVRSTVGAIHLDLYPMGAKPLLIVSPTSCDQKKKMAELELNNEIPFYILELPPVKDSDQAREYWLKSVFKFKQVLEKTTKKKITKSGLKEALNKVYLAQKEFRRLYNLRKEKGVIFGKDAMMVMNAYFFDDIEKWTKNLHILNNELEKRIEEKKWLVTDKAPRIILTGSPSIFPNMKIPILIEKSGGIVVSDDFCSSSRLLYDSVAPDEWNLYDMIPAIADRYLNPSTCPNLTPNSDRPRKLLEMVKEFKADGVVYQAFAGCHLFEMESLKIANILEKEGIPMLYIESDYNPDDLGQLSTRMEAFLESLSRQKSKKI